MKYWFFISWVLIAMSVLIVHFNYTTLFKPIFHSATDVAYLCIVFGVIGLSRQK